jgi:hypothetical protein
MGLVDVNWKPAGRDLRWFGLVMIIGMGLVGGLFYWRHLPVVSYVLWAFGAVSGLAGLSGTKVALPFYWLWMGIAFVTGNVINRVLLGAVFYLLVTPIGLIMRLTGRDRLRLRRPRGDTCWLDADYHPDVEHYERQS